MSTQEIAFRVLVERLTEQTKHRAMNPNNLRMSDLEELFGITGNTCRYRGFKNGMTVEQVAAVIIGGN